MAGRSAGSTGKRAMQAAVARENLAHIVIPSTRQT
jgi:hypothetical protein